MFVILTRLLVKVYVNHSFLPITADKNVCSCKPLCIFWQEFCGIYTCLLETCEQIPLLSMVPVPSDTNKQPNHGAKAADQECTAPRYAAAAAAAAECRQLSNSTMLNG